MEVKIGDPCGFPRYRPSIVDIPRPVAIIPGEHPWTARGPPCREGLEELARFPQKRHGAGLMVLVLRIRITPFSKSTSVQRNFRISFFRPPVPRALINYSGNKYRG